MTPIIVTVKNPYEEYSRMVVNMVLSAILFTIWLSTFRLGRFLMHMSALLSIVVLVVLYVVARKIRGPLPPSEPKYGGAGYDEETKTNPNQE